MNERFTRADLVARVDLAHEPDFALGQIYVRPSLREIAFDGRREFLDRRVMQVLVALSRNGGGVASRDDLIESCWEGVVVGEDAINTCIRRLRRAAAANGDAFSIETVPRVGFRLQVGGAVGVSQEQRADVALKQASSVLPAESSLDAASVPSARSSRARWLAAVPAVGLLLILVAVIATWRMRPKAPAGQAEASVAVLPFVNMGGDPKKEYFSDGFSEELINDLSNEPHLNVASRTSSFVFKGRNQDAETIARALRVHAIVEGSVRESGNRVRITAQLIDGRNGYHLWSAAFDRDLTDILGVQGEIASAIATALTHRLVPAPAKPRPRIDPTVYRMYLEGVYEFTTLSPPDNFRRSFEIFKQVTAKAPDFPGGYYWLAAAAANVAFSDATRRVSDQAIASAAAQRALSFDPHNMRARYIQLLLEEEMWDWRAAAADLLILRSAGANTIPFLKALRLYYAFLGFPEEALAAWRRVLSLDPSARTDANRYAILGLLDNTGRFQEEIAVDRAMLAHNQRDMVLLVQLCAVYTNAGRIAEARELEEQLHSQQVGSNSQLEPQQCQLDIDYHSGNVAGVRRELQNWESEFPDKLPSASDIGYVYMLLNDFDKASEWFERGYERREIDLFLNFYIKTFLDEEAFKKYRVTAGYRALAAKPLFREWQAEHDRIAAALAAHRDPLLPP